MPVAANCCVVPSAMLGNAGVTPMLESVAEVTVRAAVALMPPLLAWIVLRPTLVVLASPWVPAAFEIVAVPAVTFQVTVGVRFWLEPSL
jgi:hypothetical protein